MQTVNPEMRDLQQQIVELRDRISKSEGEIRQLDRATSNNARQTLWQFVIFTVSMAGILIGVINYQTNSIRNEINSRLDVTDQRINQLEKRLDNRIDSLEKHIEQSEKNILARFEDLKQEVRNRR